MPGGYRCQHAAETSHQGGIWHCGQRSLFVASDDYVGMPARERFSRNEEYFSTLYHELVHAVGHESRLNRSTLDRCNAGFGSDPYWQGGIDRRNSGAAFLCGHAEIGERTIDNSAAYVGEWLKRLRSEKTLIVHAAAKAQRAADFILGRTSEENDGAHD